MRNAQPQLRFTADDYLAWEATQNERHEYFHGEVFAMAGGTQNHNTVSGNAYLALRQHLKGAPCKVFISDMRVQVRAGDVYFYPDVVVSCQRTDVQNGLSMALESPVLIVEVLSNSTASWDRGGKFAAYREIGSLQEYLLLDPEARTADLYRRNAMGRFELFAWTLKDAEPVCTLESVGAAVPLVALFEGVEDAVSD